jgi:hypothetical protein
MVMPDENKKTTQTPGSFPLRKNHLTINAVIQSCQPNIGVA